LSLVWGEETVAQAAQRALKIMTGQEFTDELFFAQWWEVNHDGPNCLWYWEQRLVRELNDAEAWGGAVFFPRIPGDTWEDYEAGRLELRDAAYAQVRQAIAAELRQLSPEVEAKVRLLAFNEYKQIWPDPPSLRVSSDRLLDLLDRKNLWPDVLWDDKRPKRPDRPDRYVLMATRMGMAAESLFRPADVPHLREVLQRERNRLGGWGETTMIIGISRLLPPAAVDKLDDPDTRDGILRQAARESPDYTSTARELVRVGLPANAPFLTEGGFAGVDRDRANHVLHALLQAAYEPPLTPEKRRFLVGLLLDPRFEPYLAPRNVYAGTDACGLSGIWAVNAHAGGKLIDDSLKKALFDPAQSVTALAEFRRRVAQLGLSPATQPDAAPTSPDSRPVNRDK
jgi:hypothetical protein